MDCTQALKAVSWLTCLLGRPIDGPFSCFPQPYPQSLLYCQLVILSFSPENMKGAPLINGISIRLRPIVNGRTISYQKKWTIVFSARFRLVYGVWAYGSFTSRLGLPLDYYDRDSILLVVFKEGGRMSTAITAVWGSVLSSLKS